MTRFRLIVGVTIAMLLLASTFALGWLAAKTGAGTRASRMSLNDLERQFADRMSGVALVGHFTVDGRDDRADNAERYEISSVAKLDGNNWRFNARIRYGRFDMTLPVVVTMLWAGDTPMITLTDTNIPTLGTFTVRLLFYGDRYAGTWQHGRVGGHMFGRIERSGSS
jgi:hypothetical protein